MLPEALFGRKKTLAAPFPDLNPGLNPTPATNRNKTCFETTPLKRRRTQYGHFLRQRLCRDQR